MDKILFTGSPAVGRAVARACVSHEKEVTVELGGKDAMLVLADAHLAARRRAARCGPAAPAPARRAGRSSACTSRARSPSAFVAGLVRGGAAR